MTFPLRAAALALIAAAASSPALAQTRTPAEWDRLDAARYSACLDRIATEPEEAFEDSLAWRGEGGGALAQHCGALALVVLGSHAEAAARLEAIAILPDAGRAQERAAMFRQAGDAWLLAKRPVDAERAYTFALSWTPGDLDVFVERGQAFAAQDRRDDARRDYDTVLASDPNHQAALRLRADDNLLRGDLLLAEADITRAITLDPTDVEAHLLNGRLREARRLQE